MSTHGFSHCTRGRMVTGWHVICDLHCRRVWARVASDAPAQSLMAPLLRPMLQDLASAPSSTGTLQSTHAVKGTNASPNVGKSTPVYMYRLGMCLIQMVLVRCKGDAALSNPATSRWPQRLLETVVPGCSYALYLQASTPVLLMPLSGAGMPAPPGACTLLR